jgi:hypothetical protein
MKLNGIFLGFCVYMLVFAGLEGAHQGRIYFEVAPEESVEILSQRVAESMGGQAHIVLLIQEPTETEQPRYYAVASNDDLYQRSVAASSYRSYEHEVTAEEKSVISSIVLTLANNSYAKLLLKKSELDKKGSDIDHVHPLRHLACIFTDEELKVAIRNIREKSLVWKNYVHGLGESLAQESHRDNLTELYIRDFAALVGINPDLIFAPLAEGRWRDFIELLIDSIPRKGNPRRYDM